MPEIELNWKGKRREVLQQLPIPTLNKVQREQTFSNTLEAYWDNENKVPNQVENCLIQGENLQVMSALLPKFRGKFDLLYFDPPFFTGKDWKNRNDELAYSDSWGEGLPAYLQFLYDRMSLARELLAETGVEPIGKIVIGTVKGDIHDIGKNLVSMMLEGAGFEVIDLGINNPVEKYLEALDKHKPDILGMSALLTTTMPYMKVVIDTLKERGIRNDYIVLVGGAPLNEEFGKAVGADAYCRDAAVAVETGVRLLVDIARVVDGLDELLAADVVASFRGLDEVVVGDLQRRPDLAELAGHIVDVGPGLDAELLGGLLDLDGVLVVAHQEVDRVSLHPAEPSLDVGADLLERGADVGPAVGVVDRRGDIEAHRSRLGPSVGLAGDRLFKRRCRRRVGHGGPPRRSRRRSYGNLGAEANRARPGRPPWKPRGPRLS